jgi:hypothetical protein
MTRLHNLQYRTYCMYLNSTKMKTNANDLLTRPVSQ